MVEQGDLLSWRAAPAPTPVEPAGIEGLLLDPIWPKLRPHLRLTLSGTTRRIDVLGSCPEDVVGLAAQVRTPCAACGAPINPLRARPSKHTGRGGKSHYYVSPSCPLGVSPGCSRGAAAKAAVDRVVRALALAQQG